MNKKFNVQFKQTRVRLNPNKKWSPVEEKALIEFLLNNYEIEKPTAQVYYRRFCDQTNFNIAWKVVRSKVKNMRNSFFRAKCWENGEEAATLNKEDVENGVLRKCSNYYELEPIFGDQILELSTRELYKTEHSLESESSNFPTSIIIDSDDDISQRTEDENFPSISRTHEPEMAEQKPDLVDIKPPQLSQELNIKCMEMGVNVNELLLKDKLKLMELILKEKRLELKERRLISSEKTKLYEINSQEKVKILELEMKERLTREELKLKYK